MMKSSRESARAIQYEDRDAILALHRATLVRWI